MEKLNFDFEKRIERVKDYLSTKNAIFINEYRDDKTIFSRLMYIYEDSLININILNYDENSLTIHYKYNDYENNNNHLDSPTIEFSVQEIPAKMVHFERIMKKSFNFFIKMLKLYKDKYIR